MDFKTVADVLHHLINIVPWREEAHALAAHEVIARELGDARGAGSTDTASPNSEDGPRASTPAAPTSPASEGSKATSSPATPDASK